MSMKTSASPFAQKSCVMPRRGRERRERTRASSRRRRAVARPYIRRVQANQRSVRTSAVNSAGHASAASERMSTRHALLVCRYVGGSFEIIGCLYHCERQVQPRLR